MAALLLAPWLIRNLIVMHAFVPFSTGGGSLLLQANNRQVIEDPSYAGYAVFDFSLPEYAAPIRNANDEVKRDAIAKKFAIQWLRANPDKWFYLIRSKFIRLWRVDYAGYRFHNLAWILVFTYGIAVTVFALAVVPFTVRMVRMRHPGSIMVCLILATIASALIFHGQHRYRFPIDAFCISIAAGGAFRMWNALRGRTGGEIWANARTFIGGNSKQLILACVFVLGVTIWCRADDRHIEAWRSAECERRLEAIRDATVRYRKVHGDLPGGLSVLVPEFLPNVEALHCPEDTISYSEHALLPATNADSVPRLISYCLVLPSAPGVESYVAEMVPHHGDFRSAVTLSGKLFRIPFAPQTLFASK
jgi:hypothetical protein